jgi:hypothetical protein
LYLLRSCGLLLMPALAWNLVFYADLPPAFLAPEFWRDIPPLLHVVESATRLVVFVLPFLMPLDWSSRAGRLGLALFVVGTVVYFGSWLPLMLAPRSGWATSPWGFAAPAYTPAIWLLGISLMGQRLFALPAYRWWVYCGVSATFVGAHVAHVLLVFHRVF